MERKGKERKRINRSMAMMSAMSTSGVLVAAAFMLCSLILTTEAQISTQIYHVCTNTTSFTLDSTYGINLNTLLLPNLSSNARTKWFYNVTVGNEDPSYRLFLCRFDISTDDCHNSVVKAGLDIRQRCGNEREAIIWYGECMLRYANRNFLSTREVLPTGFILSTQNISDNITEQYRFNMLLQGTMSDVATRAANNSSDKKFAVQEVQFSEFPKVYTLLECTLNLSPDFCNQCLQRAIDYLPGCCSGKRGARVVTPSCIVWYENLQFYGNETAKAIPPAPPPSTRGKGSSSLPVIVAPLVSVVAVLLLFGIWFFFYRAKSEVNSQQCPRFKFEVVSAATQHFSNENILGQGGFGPVYKGTLMDGKEIAVKRLSTSSKQGAVEFNNEVNFIANLQHRNLVRLLGCCVEKSESLLIYEYMPNKSLDVFLFAKSREGVELDWRQRLVIINGIARGLMYLHEDSRLTIIHRDLKPGNILLDHEMNPKISDFGLARLFDVNQIEANTTKIAGSHGYMAPEYISENIISLKSDIFSFGVILLEIISGKRNSRFHIPDHTLLTYAWKLWSDGQGLDLIDPILEESYVPAEVLKCIQIGLLCVQHDPAARPTISSVVYMLSNDTTKLPQPKQPAHVFAGPAPQSTPEAYSANKVTLTLILPR